MFTAQFSEFTYGFAITDNFIHSGIPHTGVVPTFPSLIAEGSAGGYDVSIPLCPVPLFLQFKIPQVVRRRSRMTPYDFSTPYLRMHLRTKRPNQHRLLLDWEAQGNLVYYATPDFWLTRDLDKHFANRTVHRESRYIQPSQIGPLDNRPHHLAYEEGNEEFWRCSRPIELEGNFGSEKFAHTVQDAIRRATPQLPLDFLQSIASGIRELTGIHVPQMREVDEEDGPETANFEKKLSPQELEERARRRESRLLSRTARQVAYMSQVHLGCSFCIIGN